MFWICSRIFSSSAFMAMTVSAMALSAHLEPVVFISRFISCTRKIELPPHGGTAIEHQPKLRYMASKTHRLLIDRHAVGVNGRLLQDAPLVNACLAKGLLHFGKKPLAVLLHRLGRALLHRRNHRLDGVQLSPDVGGELVPFPGAHFVKMRQRLAKHRTDGICDGALVRVGALSGDDLRHTKKRRRGHIVPHTEFFRREARRLYIRLRHRLVYLDGDLLRLRGVHGDENVHLAAGDDIRHRRADALLREHTASRQTHGGVQMAVIDAFELRRHGDAAVLSFRAAVAGHAFYHEKYLASLFR